MYMEVMPGPPPDMSVTREERFKTANFSLPLGPWYPGDNRLPDQSFEVAMSQTQFRMRQNGNFSR